MLGIRTREERWVEGGLVAPIATTARNGGRTNRVANADR